MTLDTGPQFVLKMWDSLCKLLKINAKLSMAFHHEIDGQSKNANQEMKYHLHSYVNHFQDDWIELLPMAKCSGNTNTSSITKLPSFFVSCGVVLWINVKLVELSIKSTQEQLVNSTAQSIADCMQEVWDFVREEMTNLQSVQAAAANQYQKEPLRYEIRDIVWLSTQNMKIKRPSKKLDYKMIGFYQIKAYMCWNSETQIRRMAK